jgi:non-heme chloroperoxidase
VALKGKKKVFLRGRKKVILNVAGFLVIPVVIYLVIASVMIMVGKPGKSATTVQQNLEFKELYFNYSGLPELESFQARDGKDLYYRYYPAKTKSDKTLILLHGSGWHSRYFLPLAEYISSENLANVYTPDLRGHGKNPVRRGDVDYINQLEDDIADFITVIKQKNPGTTIILGGHSSGGGLAIRFAGSKYNDLVAGYMLLSPFLKYNAPTIRPNAGGWAKPYTGRIVGLSMLNNIGIRLFNYLTVIEFNMPQEARDGTETLSYTFRMNTAFAPRDYKKDIAAMYQPVLVAAGTGDESFLADQFEPIFSKYTKAKVVLLDSVTHMGIVVGPEVRPVIKEWLEGFN